MRDLIMGLFYIMLIIVVLGVAVGLVSVISSFIVSIFTAPIMVRIMICVGGFILGAVIFLIVIGGKGK